MNSFERVVKQAGEILRRKQVATYWKIPNDIRMAGDELIFGERGPCDFIGHTTQGQAILIECKQRSKPSLGVGNRSKDVKGHQWMALRDAEMCGAIALILWQRDGEFAALSWGEANELRGTAKSIPWPELGARQLEGEDAAVVVASALIERIDLGSQARDAAREMVDRRA